MQPGELVAERFEVERRVTGGGMGAVYRAKDRSSGAPVALKVLAACGPNDAARFEREAELLSQLSHPGIVRYVAHGTTTAGSPFLAMEWLEGEDLGARLAREGLTPGQSVALCARAAEALASAHRLGVVHRDLKPGNLFLVERRLDRVKLIDFGIATAGEAASALTRTGVMIGTPGYMAPEQARASRDVDARADVYALGCVLFRCVAGRDPFVADDPLAALMKTVLEEPPRLRDVRLDVPAELDELVARMLAKVPELRPRDASAVATALGELGPFDPAAVARPSAGPPSLTTGERRARCIVLARRPHDGLDPNATLSLAQVKARDASLAEAVESRGGRLELLADGSLLATVARDGAPMDQAARAARIALVVAELLPDARVAVVTGRDALSRRVRMGEVVDRATSLLGPTSEGPGVRLDGATAGLLGARFELERRGEAWRLAGERSDDDAPADEAPFVGRERDLETLRALLDECASQPVARAALVLGDAGAGKSRLRREFARSLGRDGEVRVWSLAAGGAGTLASALVARATEAIAGVSPGIPLVTALGAACDDGPLVVLLDDLGDADAASVAALGDALGELADRPLLVVAFARPAALERFPRLWRERDAVEIRLTELSRRAADRLVRSLLGSGADPAAVAAVVEQGAGNPFELEQIARARAVGGGDGPPDVVVAMAQAELDGLEAEARRVLRAASVFGTAFRRSGVLALLGGERRAGQVDPWFDELARRGLIERDPSADEGPDAAYSFASVAAREAAFAMLTDDDRALGLRLADEWRARSSSR